MYVKIPSIKEMMMMIIIIIITTNFGLQGVKILPLNSIPCQSISNKDRPAELFSPRHVSAVYSLLFYIGPTADKAVLTKTYSPFLRHSSQFYFSSFSGRRYIAEFQLRLQGFLSLSVMPQASIVIKMEENLYRGR